MARAQSGATNLLVFCLSLLGCMTLHAGANVANNYYDWLLGADKAHTSKALSGGSRLLQNEEAQLDQLRTLYRILYCIAGLCGLYVAWLTNYLVLVFGLLGLLTGHGYTAPPASLAYRGWGELATGITFGPLAVLGSYYAQTTRLDWQPLLASIPIGLLITAVLYINEVPDRLTDQAAGKWTWAVLTKGRGVGIYQALLLLAMISATPLLITVNRWLVGIFLALALLGLHIARQGKQLFVTADCLMPVQIKTIIFYALTGLFLCAVYLQG